MSEVNPQTTLEPTIIKPNIIKPSILGQGSPGSPGSSSSGSGANDLSQFGADDTQDPDAEAAKQREFLANLLGVLGYPDLPATRTDLLNQSTRLQQLQQQVGQAIKDLQSSGVDLEQPVPGLDAAGPPDPAVATKIATLADLQEQLKAAGEAFKNYAYSYFSGLDKPLTLSASTILQAYSAKVLTRDQAKARLAAEGMSEEDIGIVLGTQDKQDVKTLGADTVLSAYEGGGIGRGDAIQRLLDQGYSLQDAAVLIKMSDAKGRAAAGRAQRATSGGSSGGSARSSGSSSSSSSGSSSGSAPKPPAQPQVNVNVKVDTAQLARDALEQARSRAK